MSLSLALQMSAFALAASISPGPVNMVCLSSGTRYGMRPTLKFVSGATIGFILLLVAVGLGLAAVLAQLPALTTLLRWGGIAFLLYLSWQLTRDNGVLAENEQDTPPGFLSGAAMQWLNPKAWLASASGIGAYTRGSDLSELTLFALLYAPICWASLSCWAFAGGVLRQQVARPSVLRAVNRCLAALLAGSCAFLLID